MRHTMPQTSWKASSILSDEELQQLDPQNIPEHVAFIPDGNRRWAKKHRVLPEEGHEIGAETLLNCIKAAYQIGIKRLTFYIFSTENWLRPQKEINAQMKLLEKSLRLQQPHMLENGVRFLSIGDLSKFPSKITYLVEETQQATSHCDQIDVIFAMNYGGRDDLCRAFQKMVIDYHRGVFQQEAINESLISRYLDTAAWKDPDLLIRTSGETRISNFLLWQLSYTELFFSPLFWPEFTPHHFLEAVLYFQKRERRLGGS